MKSIFQIAFVALLLFSVSAALSLWLNQSKQAAADPTQEKNEKKSREPEKKDIVHQKGHDGKRQRTTKKKPGQNSRGRHDIGFRHDPAFRTDPAVAT